MSFIQLCSSSFVSLVQKLPLVLFVYIVFRLIGVWRKLRHRDAALSPVPGPPARWPLIGNLDLFWDAKKGLNFTIKERLTAMSVLYEKLGIFKLYIGLQPVVYLFKPNTVQAILSNAAVIDKSHEYSMVECWLGKGLGTRNGDEWRTRRKVLGPAFHFTVLQDFIPIINEQSRIFCQVLQNKSDTDDISQLSINCALDIICETALGVKLNTQREPLNAYAKALHRVTEIFVVRILSPWLWPDMVFFNLPLGREMTRQIAILHAFTRGVIRNRKQDLLAELQKMSKLDTEQLDTALGGQQVGTAKRLAFLDMLIKLHMEGVLTEEEVREEVDMFTFAGHDTTGISIAFAMFCIGLHPEVQRKLQQEVDAIFGDDRERPVTADDLRRMPYLECTIKESLRLYPAGPFFARQLAEEVDVEGYRLPRGTVVWLCIMSLHMNQEVYPEPARFDPDRFAPQPSRDRHPYAYLPFSGGPRACLGHKFAMMEEKIILANVLRKFRITTLGSPDKLVLASEIILRPKCPICVTCTPR